MNVLGVYLNYLNEEDINKKPVQKKKNSEFKKIGKFIKKNSTVIANVADDIPLLVGQIARKI
jgi:hypothetical protein